MRGPERGLLGALPRRRYLWIAAAVLAWLVIPRLFFLGDRVPLLSIASESWAPPAPPVRPPPPPPLEFRPLQRLDDFRNVTFTRSMHPRLYMSFTYFVGPHYPWEPLLRVYLEAMRDMGLGAQLWAMEISVNYILPDFTNATEGPVQASRSYVAAMRKGLQTVASSIIAVAKVALHEGNEFEYRGIAKTWDFGMDASDADDLVLYGHGRGVTRGYHCVGTLTEVFARHHEIRNLFRSSPALNVVGNDLMYGTGHTGCDSFFVWYNFFWVRARHLRTRVKPSKVTRRHYYENWLCLAAELDAATGLPAHNRSRVTTDEVSGTKPITRANMAVPWSGYSITKQQFCEPIHVCAGLPLVFASCSPFIVPNAPTPLDV